MDEYLFIALAKLKADRLQSQRLREAPDPEQLRLAWSEPAGPQWPPARPRWFSQQPLWREQS